MVVNLLRVKLNKKEYRTKCVCVFFFFLIKNVLAITMASWRIPNSSAMQMKKARLVTVNLPVQRNDANDHIIVISRHL